MTSGKVILLVDDDVDDQEIFIGALQNISAPLHCNIAVNGQDALNKLTSGQFTPDLIFLDLNMPLMNGKQFIVRISTYDRYKNIPIVILSTSSDKENIEEVKRLGVNHFITKPDSFNKWEAVIRDILDQFLLLPQQINHDKGKV